MFFFLSADRNPRPEVACAAAIVADGLPGRLLTPRVVLRGGPSVPCECLVVVGALLLALVALHGAVLQAVLALAAAAVVPPILMLLIVPAFVGAISIDPAPVGLM